MRREREEKRREEKGREKMEEWERKKRMKDIYRVRMDVNAIEVG